MAADELRAGKGRETSSLRLARFQLIDELLNHIGVSRRTHLRINSGHFCAAAMPTNGDAYQSQPSLCNEYRAATVAEAQTSP